MNILLSAYACEPNKGSEPGVGWGWALEWAKKHDVWIITRDNNKTVIDKYLRLHSEIDSTHLHFVYVGLSRKFTFWKKGRRGIRLYYMLWQKKAYRVAKALKKDIKFDFVQHITFVSYTQPTYMYKLGLPMIWGPVSGGENIPDTIKIKMSIKERIIEKIRSLSQSLALITPCIKKTMLLSKFIFVATEETKDRIPHKYWNKTFVIPAIGIEKIPNIKIKNNNEQINIVMAGRLIYWKAFDIGLKAFLKIADEFPEVSLHILGEGEKKEALKISAGIYLDKQVFFDEPVEHDKIYEYYSGFDIFLNTTLRDSGCMTMMEAMCVGLPCIAITCGGPGFLIKELGGISIDADDNNIIDELSLGLKELINNSKLRNDISSRSSSKLQKITYKNKCSEIETLFKG